MTKRGEPLERTMMVVVCTRAIVLFAVALPVAAQQGKVAYETRCVLCHAGDGGGTDRAPSIQAFVERHLPERIAAVIRDGVPNKGMPAFKLPDSELAPLVEYVRTLRAPADYLGRGGNAPRPRHDKLRLFDGRVLEGLVLNQSGFDATIRTADGRLHRLRGEPGAYREARLDPHVDWASYHGSYTGNRHSELEQIHAGNVGPAPSRMVLSARGPAHDRRHSGGHRRRDVRDRAEPSLRARRRDRPRDLALGRAAYRRPARRRLHRHQPRRCGPRRPGLHRDGPRLPGGARPLDGREALGSRDGRLPHALWRDGGAARRGRFGCRGHLRRRPGAARLPRRLSCRDRRAGLAFLDDSRSGRAGRGNLGRRRRAREGLRRDMADG